MLAGAVYMQSPCVCPSVYLSGTVAKHLGEISTGSSPTGAPNRGGVAFKLAILDQHFAISQKRCKIGT